MRPTETFGFFGSARGASATLCKAETGRTDAVGLQWRKNAPFTLKVTRTNGGEFDSFGPGPRQDQTNPSPETGSRSGGHKKGIKEVPNRCRKTGPDRFRPNTCEAKNRQ
jgi:hypothetical protein